MSLALSTTYYPQLQQAAGAWAYASAGGAGAAAVAGLSPWGMDYVSLQTAWARCCCCCHGHATSRITEDPYGVGQSGQGRRSNLANSPEVMLALRDILKDGGGKSYDQVAKELKEKYGIQAEVGDIESVDKDGRKTTAKGLKFANGDYFVDGNGDNQLSKGDYKFDDAIKALKEKYGLQDDDLTRITEGMKSRASLSGGSGWSQGVQGMGLYGGYFYPPWMFLFARAFQMAA